MENKILKPENLKVGYWYKTNETHSWLFKFTRKTKDRIFGTHFCTPFDMYYIKDYHKEMDDNCINYIEATKAEVAKMFPKEIYTNKPMKQPKQQIEYYEVIKAFPNNKLGIKYYKDDDMWEYHGSEADNSYNTKIMSNTEYFKPHYKTQQIKIGSYNVEFLPKGSIKIGCAYYSLGDVKACLKVLELPNALHISFAGSIVNKEIINKILNRVKK